MPRYDYQCAGGHKYELTQPFGSATEHPCEKCGKPAKRVILVAPPLVFKAGGYYKTSGRNLSSGSSDATEPGGTSSNRSSSPPEKSEKKAESSSKTAETKAKRADRVKGAG